jgi:hypothetical protein
MHAVQPDWERDGRRVAFKAWDTDPSGTISGGIFIMKTDCSDMKMLLELIEAGYPAILLDSVSQGGGV